MSSLNMELNAQWRVSQSGYNTSFLCLLAIMLTLDNFSNDKLVAVKNLVTYTFVTGPRSKVLFTKSFEEDSILVRNTP